MRHSKRSGCGFVAVLLLSVLLLGGAWLYTTWRSGETVLPPGLSINGVPMGGMTRQQALFAVEQAYTTAISVTYAGDTTPPLLPEMIELRLDMQATSENLDAALATQSGGRALLNHIADQLLGRDVATTDVRAVVLYSRERVDAFLQRTAQKYDRAPMQAVALPQAGSFRPAQDGTTLDIEASLPLMIEAILAADPARRHVELVVEVEPVPAASTDLLAQALGSTLTRFDGVAGVFVKDLQTGHELCINCQLPFTGWDPLKLGIALETYRIQTQPLRPDLTAAVQTMLTQGDSTAANQLLAEMEKGDPQSGATTVTKLLWSLGLRSSYLDAPYGTHSTLTAPAIATPANERSDAITDPDPYVQTTPAEIGLLLESLYHCGQGGGSLLLLYPDALSPTKCHMLLSQMRPTEKRGLLQTGMPAGTRIAYQSGRHGRTDTDASLVYGPLNDFVIVTFLYHPSESGDETSATTFAEIGLLTYRFFNGHADPTLAAGH